MSRYTILTSVAHSASPCLTSAEIGKLSLREPLICTFTLLFICSFNEPSLVYYIKINIIFDFSHYQNRTQDPVEEILLKMMTLLRLLKKLMVKFKDYRFSSLYLYIY